MTIAVCVLIMALTVVSIVLISRPRKTVKQKHETKQQEKRQAGQFHSSYKSSSQPPLRHTDSGHYSWVHTTDVPDDSSVRPHVHAPSHDHTPSYDHRPEADIAPVDSHSSWSSGSDSGGGSSSCSSGSDSGSSSSCGGSSCGGGD